MTKQALVSLVTATVLISSCGIHTGHQSGVYPNAQFGSDAEMRYNNEMANAQEVENLKNAESIDADTRKAIDNAVQDME